MSRQDDLRKLINIHHRRLQELEQKRALFGIDVAPEIIIEIENIKVEIEKLQAELAELDIKIALSPQPDPFLLPEMVLIPFGQFFMGTKPQDVDYYLTQEWSWVKNWYVKRHYEWEQPAHKVTLSAFKISRFPITNRQYAMFTQTTGYQKPKHWDNGRYSLEDEDHPVVNISWYDANHYCNWLSNLTEQEYRLPTEAEWEKAARGPNGYIWPWGNEWDPQRCNCKFNRIGHLLPVNYFGQTSESPYQVVDMVGNVAEWCTTKWGKLWEEPQYRYPYTKNDGREARDGHELRITRGGSYRGSTGDIRCAARSRYQPDKGVMTLGFRCVCTYH